MIGIVLLLFIIQNQIRQQLPAGADFRDFVVLTPDEVSIAHFCPNAGTKTRQGVAFLTSDIMCPDATGWTASAQTQQDGV